MVYPRISSHKTVTFFLYLRDICSIFHGGYQCFPRALTPNKKVETSYANKSKKYFLSFRKRSLLRYAIIMLKICLKILLEKLIDIGRLQVAWINFLFTLFQNVFGLYIWYKFWSKQGKWKHCNLIQCSLSNKQLIGIT